MKKRESILCAVIVTGFLLSSAAIEAAILTRVVYRDLITALPVSHPVLPLEFLDQPQPGATIHMSSTVLQVSGWAVSESGIDSVSVYIDRQYSASATIRMPRPDVKKVYPNMKDAEESGWWATLPLTSIGPGAHDLLVQVKAGNGAIRDLDVSIDVRP